MIPFIHATSDYALPFPGRLCLPQGRGYVLLSAWEVEYFEADNNACWVVTHSGASRSMIMVRLYEVAQSLGGPLFCRIHKSFVVGISHVVEMDLDKTSVRLHSGVWLPIGRSYQKSFLDTLLFCK